MFWFVMYVNESIESTHRERVRFQGSNFVALFTFKKSYFSSCSRFGAHIVSTVILTNYERTHKATTRQSVWNRFYWQSKIRPPICAPFGTKSYMIILNSTANWWVAKGGLVSDGGLTGVCWPCAAATWTQSSMRRLSGTTKRSTSCRKVEVRSATMLMCTVGISSLCLNVHYMCSVCIAQHFELHGRCFRNCHHYCNNGRFLACPHLGSTKGLKWTVGHAPKNKLWQSLFSVPSGIWLLFVLLFTSWQKVLEL